MFLALGPRAEDSIFWLSNITVDNRGEYWIFFPIEAAGTFEFCLAFDDPGVGCLFSAESFSLDDDCLAAPCCTARRTFPRLSLALDLAFD